MKHDDLATNTSVLGGFGLALLGTTCCALPIALVALGMGSSVASLVVGLPWLTTLSQYKAVTFSVTAMLLVYSFWRLHNVGQCGLSDRYRLRWQARLLRFSTIIFAVAVFAAYGMLPLLQWWDGQ
jgi:hypothetical protein